MNKHWITVKEASKILNISDRAVRKSCDSGKYQYHYEDGVGRGGKQLLISLESLPQEAQDRYNGIEKEPELLIERYSLTQIKEAEYKASIVLDFQRSGVSADKFLQNFNQTNNECITTGQLYLWQKKYKNGGIEALIDTRGGYNKGACSISEKAWDMFYTLYMTTQKRSIKMFYSYAGNDAKKRPEHMQKTNKVLDGDKDIPTLEFYIEKLERYIDEYNNTAHHGDGMDGKTPNQVYHENITEIREIGDSNALRLLFGKTVERTVQKNGIAMYNNTFTNSDGKLIPYYSKKVMVTYDPDDLETVYIFDTDYNYICSASAKLKTPFRSCNEEDYIRAGKEKCAVRQFAKKYKPKQCKSTFDLIAEYQLEELQYREEQSPDVQVRKVATSYSSEIERTLEDSQQEKAENQSIMEDIMYNYYKKNA